MNGFGINSLYVLTCDLHVIAVSSPCVTHTMVVILYVETQKSFTDLECELHSQIDDRHEM